MKSMDLDTRMKARMIEGNQSQGLHESDRDFSGHQSKLMLHVCHYIRLGYKFE